jgi:cell division protein FtsB
MLDKKKNLVANIDNLSAQIKDLEDEISDLDSLSKSDA